MKKFNERNNKNNQNKKTEFEEERKGE
jgi:hypothetical protein